MISSLYKYERHFLLIPILVIALSFAWDNIFIQDDAFIAFRYARHFAQGYGLVWYPGSTEFGFTNFLYTFLIGVAILFSIPPDIASTLINFICFTGAMIVTYAMALRLYGNRWIAPMPVLLLAANHSFTSCASGGLETMMVSLLILLFYHQILTRGDRAESVHYIRLGTLAAVALLTRLDTALLLLPGYVYTMFTGMDRIGVRSALAQARRMYEAIVIPVAVLAGFLLCCYFAYGQILPNSFYIKTPDDDGLIRYGLHYLWLYNILQIYAPLAVPAMILYFGISGDNFRNIGSFALMLGAMILFWCSYIVYVGGDFMEFRFLVPILPFYYLFIFRMIPALIERRVNLVLGAVLVVFCIGNFTHASLFKTRPQVLDFNNKPRNFNYAFVESTDSLHDWLRVPKRNWTIIGQGLGKLFYTGSKDDVKIAVANAGAVPYYSGLPTFDVLGLNSRSVLTNYNSTNVLKFNYSTQRPGHKVIAGDQLLVSEKVNLNLAFPQAVCRRSNRYTFMDNPVQIFPFTRKETLFLPLGNSCYAVADYVTPHPKIEELIKKNVIVRYKTVQNTTDCPAWLCLK